MGKPATHPMIRAEKLYKYMIYIPEEGHWPIRGLHANKTEARTAYLAWAERKRIPAGAFISKDE